MSILLHHPKVSPAIAAPALTWAVADEGFWVADDAGAFAGTIDRSGTHYFVRNGFAEYLGEYRTLPAAQAVLNEYAARTCSEPPC